MPDNWEYPWFNAWDLALHAVTLAYSSRLAKYQLWPLPGVVPAPQRGTPGLEWDFDDLNPPVHAWAARVVYVPTGGRGGDRALLDTWFQKLLINFAWWVNRKDAEGNNIFEGGLPGP